MVTCSPGQPTSTRQCPPHLAFHGVELPMAAAVRAGMDEPALLKASRPSQVILQHAILANGPAEHCLRAAAEPSKILLEIRVSERLAACAGRVFRKNETSA